MRSRKTVLFVVVLFLLPLVLVPGARAARKRQTVIVALDQSGSMVQSDPNKLRIEAAGLLAATEGVKDRVGIIAFGDTAQWLQQPVDREQFDFALLDHVGSSAAHTAFAPVLNAINSYLSVLPASFFESNDVSLVLLTDGRSDPAVETADADTSSALAIAGRNAARLKIYTIGLGKNVDQGFLQQLSQASHGIFIPAASAADLPEAFLRVAARTAALPVYVRSSQPTRLEWTGTPTRVLSVFTGENAKSVQMEGTVLYDSAHVAVVEQDPAHDNAEIKWTGSGNVFLCVQEPLILSTQGEFPAALLTNAPQTITLDLHNAQQRLKNLYFLQSAIAYVELSGADHEIVPLDQDGSTGRFTGKLQAQSAGVFLARAYLDSPYGQVETFLGDLTASVVPVGIPAQVSAGVFDPLPRSWFAQKFAVEPLLPVGAIQLAFNGVDRPAGLPAGVLVAPGQQPELKIVADGKLGSVQTERYLATWTDGTTEITRTGTLRILTSQMSVPQLVREKWPWMAAVLLLLLGIASSIWKFWPRPLEADVIVRQNGAQVMRLQMPGQLRTRMLHVAESDHGASSGSDRAVIAGPQSRELLSLQSTRRRGRWTIVAHPRAARVPAQQYRKSTEIDLRAIHVPVFYTDDGTIQINVLYS